MQNNSVLSSLLAVSLVAGLITACASTAGESVAALLPKNSNAAYREVKQVVNKALSAKQVPIAQDVFQESSKLLLTPAPRTAPNGIEVYDKKVKPALVFELRKRGNTCLLKRLDNNQELLLNTQVCIER